MLVDLIGRCAYSLLLRILLVRCLTSQSMLLATCTEFFLLFTHSSLTLLLLLLQCGILHASLLYTSCWFFCPLCFNRFVSYASLLFLASLLVAVLLATWTKSSLCFTHSSFSSLLSSALKWHLKSTSCSCYSPCYLSSSGSRFLQPSALSLVLLVCPFAVGSISFVHTVHVLHQCFSHLHVASLLVHYRSLHSFCLTGVALQLCLLFASLTI